MTKYTQPYSNQYLYFLFADPTHEIVLYYCIFCGVSAKWVMLNKGKKFTKMCPERKDYAGKHVFGRVRACGHLHKEDE